MPITKGLTYKERLFTEYYTGKRPISEKQAKELGLKSPKSLIGNATKVALLVYDVKPANADALGPAVAKRDRVQNALREAAEEAVEEIRSLSRGANSESVRLSASKDILDRTGYKAGDARDDNGAKEEMRNLLSGVTEAELQRIILRTPVKSPENEPET